jgi:hypothetical protein
LNKILNKLFLSKSLTRSGINLALTYPSRNWIYYLY